MNNTDISETENATIVKHVHVYLTERKRFLWPNCETIFLSSSPYFHLFILFNFASVICLLLVTTSHLNIFYSHLLIKYSLLPYIYSPYVIIYPTFHNIFFMTLYKTRHFIKIRFKEKNYIRLSFWSFFSEYCNWFVYDLDNNLICTYSGNKYV